MRRLVVLSLLASSLLAQQGNRFQNVDYAGAGRSDQMLDLDLPDGPGPFPLLLYIHGGGWSGGDKRLGAATGQFRQRVLANGFAFASANYRLSGTAKWPAQIQDCKAAVRFLRVNAAQYRLDPNRFAVWGTSAGGHLVAMLGTAGDVAEFDDPALGSPGVSSRVQAVIDWYGPADLPRLGEGIPPSCPNPVRHGVPGAADSNLLGCLASDCPDAARGASPVSYASPDDPPFLIMHGTNDCTVPAAQSHMLAEALRRQRVPAWVRSLPGGVHGGAKFQEPALQRMFDDFLMRVFAEDPPATGSAADYNYMSAAPGEALALFSPAVADGPRAAPELPLPVEMAGLQVEVTGADGTSRQAGIYSVSPGQVNFHLPRETGSGPAEVHLRKNDGVLDRDRLHVEPSAPTLFTADQTGSRWAAGQNVYADGSWTYLAEWDEEKADWTPVPVTVTGERGAPVIVLYGTGLGPAPSASIEVWISDEPATLLYGGPQPEYPGLDQYNIAIPETLAGRGDVVVSLAVGGAPANPVMVRVE